MTDLSNQEIDSIIKLLKLKKGTDLSDYARSSLNRRVNRFFDVKKISCIKDFEQRMQNEEAFADCFIDEITVNVTEMFRDAGFWIEIRDTVLPKLVERPIINIWHAACSTGEEVYSMAILLNEAGLYEKCRIVATDLNIAALKKCEKGIYLLKNQILNERNYNMFSGMKALSYYYERDKNQVKYHPALIKNVRFKRHDLVLDGSIGLFDLIICRNVLIYFNFPLQEKVLNLFTQSLAANSFLGIGSKESINWTRAEKHFQTLCLEEKIYKKKERTLNEAFIGG
ncbi:MAG: CheR family methyltransferase [Bacteroidota bacterium]